MGVFDYFRRKPDPPLDSDSLDEDLPEPRCHHYTLAHHALRSVAFQNPLAYLGVLASEDAESFLADLLKSVSAHCQGREDQPDFGIQDMVIHKVRAGEHPCAVIEMPRPRAMTEAFFVAGVLLVDPHRPVQEPSDVKLRYFTLEKGILFEGPPQARTVLCEWTSEGSHLNFGNGPQPRLDAFLAAVAELLAKSE